MSRTMESLQIKWSYFWSLSLFMNRTGWHVYINNSCNILKIKIGTKYQEANRALTEYWTFSEFELEAHGP